MYIGIDAHSASCTIAVLGPTGRRISSQVIETNGKSLVAAVSAVPSTRHILFEEGNLAAWMYELSSTSARDRGRQSCEEGARLEERRDRRLCPGRVVARQELRKPRVQEGGRIRRARQSVPGRDARLGPGAESHQRAAALSSCAHNRQERSVHYRGPAGLFEEAGGYQVSAKKDTENVARSIAEANPDLIILDVIFPENPQADFISVQAFIEKPVEPSVLLDKIKTLLTPSPV